MQFSKTDTAQNTPYVTGTGFNREGHTRHGKYLERKTNGLKEGGPCMRVQLLKEI